MMTVLAFEVTTISCPTGTAELSPRFLERCGRSKDILCVSTLGQALGKPCACVRVFVWLFGHEGTAPARAGTAVGEVGLLRGRGLFGVSCLRWAAPAPTLT